MKQQESFHLILCVNFGFFQLSFGEISKKLFKLMIFWLFHIELQHFSFKNNKLVSFSPSFQPWFVNVSWDELMNVSKLFYRRKVSAGSFFFSRKIRFWNVACISTVLASNSTHGFVACITGSVSFKTVGQLLHRQETLIQSCFCSGNVLEKGIFLVCKKETYWYFFRSCLFLVLFRMAVFLTGLKSWNYECCLKRIMRVAWSRALSFFALTIFSIIYCGRSASYKLVWPVDDFNGTL